MTSDAAHLDLGFTVTLEQAGLDIPVRMPSTCFTGSPRTPGSNGCSATSSTWIGSTRDHLAAAAVRPRRRPRARVVDSSARRRPDHGVDAGGSSRPWTRRRSSASSRTCSRRRPPHLRQSDLGAREPRGQDVLLVVEDEGNGVPDSPGRDLRAPGGPARSRPVLASGSPWLPGCGAARQVRLGAGPPRQSSCSACSYRGLTGPPAATPGIPEQRAARSTRFPIGVGTTYGVACDLPHEGPSARVGRTAPRDPLPPDRNGNLRKEALWSSDRETWTIVHGMLASTCLSSRSPAAWRGSGAFAPDSSHRRRSRNTCVAYTSACGSWPAGMGHGPDRHMDHLPVVPRGAGR
jgi:hypothetical protein